MMVGFVEWKVIKTLFSNFLEGRVVSVSQLCRDSDNICYSHVHKVVRGLLRDGLVRYENMSSGRRSGVFLTDKGCEYYRYLVVIRSMRKIKEEKKKMRVDLIFGKEE